MEADTRLLSRKTTAINQIDCAHEHWSWDGVNGQSLIFYSDDVQHLSDDDTNEMVKPLKIDEASQITIKRKEKYTFVNFNFKVDS